MIKLEKSLLIREGTRRGCYKHPSDPSLCIKIPMSTRNGILQQRREIKYFNKLEKRGVSFKYISRYHGSLETTFGTGYLYDMACDYNNKVSMRLIDYMKAEDVNPQQVFEILHNVEKYLIDNEIIIYDVSPGNIALQKTEAGSLEPLIFDGVGDVVAIPVLNLSSVLVRQKIKRRWVRMIERFKTYYPYMKNYVYTF